MLQINLTTNVSGQKRGGIILILNETQKNSLTVIRRGVVEVAFSVREGEETPPTPREKFTPLDSHALTLF